MGAQFRQLFVVGPVHGNTAPLSDAKPNDFRPRNRLAARAMWCIKLAHAPSTTTPVAPYDDFAARMFLLKLPSALQHLCPSCTRLLNCDWLQEIHHLIKTDITAAYRRQQLFQLIKVVARRRCFSASLRLIPKCASSSSRIPPSSRDIFCHGPVYGTVRDFERPRLVVT